MMDLTLHQEKSQKLKGKYFQEEETQMQVRYNPKDLQNQKAPKKNKENRKEARKNYCCS